MALHAVVVLWGFFWGEGWLFLYLLLSDISTTICFQFGALVYKATINILLQTFLWMYVLISLENILIIVGSQVVYV